MNTCKNLILFTILIVFVISSFSCKKEEEKIMKVSTDSISDVSYTTARTHATIIDIGEGIEQHGHCWSTEVDKLTINDEYFTEKGPAHNTGAYNSILACLSSSTTYYVRAYVESGDIVIYGDNILTFTTLSHTIPVVTTGDITNVTTSGATVEGYLNNLGLGVSEVIQHGHCWSSETTTPIIEDNSNITSLGPRDTTGSYESILIGLYENTIYYVRAYAINEAGTGYGDPLSFKTISQIKAEFDASPKTGYAPLGVQFTDMSTGAVTSWSWNFGDGETSTSQNPYHTYADQGIYSITLTVSDGNRSDSETKTNYISVSATGTAPVANFTADRTSITEGETVNFTDQSINDPITWSWDFGDGGTSTSQNPSHQYNTEGVYTVTMSATNSYGSDIETKHNYITVIAAGAAPVANYTADRTSITEGETVNFTDQSTNGPTSWSWNFGDGGTSSSQNPSRQYNTEGTYSVTLTVANNYGSDSETKNNYITVSAIGIAPVAAFTADKTSIIKGETVYFTDQSTNNPTSWSWTFGDGGTSTSQNPTHQYNTEGTYTVALTATNSYGSDAESKSNYITVESGQTETVSDVDGNTYQTVEIGNQWWMAENLKTTKYNDGSDIPMVTDNSAWSGLSTDGYCWYNNNENTYKNTYGALYNWYTVNKGKLCPANWHVPSDDEWTELIDYLGGSTVAGGKLKETGTSHWINPNTGATDESGFTALPGGHRKSDGTFADIGYYGNWWTSSESSTYNSYHRWLENISTESHRSTPGNRWGFSIRCVKD